MAINNTSNTKQALWLMLSNFSSLALAFVSAAILSRFFDKVEYGTYRQILYVYGTLQTIFTIGLPSVFSYFIPRYNHQEGKYFVKKLNLIFVLLGLIFSLFLFLSSNLIADILNNESLALGLKIFSIFPLFTLPALGVEGLYIALKKTKYVAIYNTITKLIMLFCIIIPVIFFDGGVIQAILGWGSASLVTFVFAMYMKSKPYLGIKKKRIVNFYSTVFNYSTPLMAASLVGFFIASSNQFFISRYYGTEEFAEFSNGFLSLPIIGMVGGSIKAVLLPLFSKAQVDGELDKALISYKSAVERVVILVLPLILFCFAFSNEIMTFIYGELYYTSGKYFKASLIRDVFHILPYAAVLLATGNSKIYFKSHLVSAIFLLPLSYILSISSYSPLIIIYLFVLIEILRHIFLFKFIYKKEKLNLIPRDLLKKIITVVIHITLLLTLIYYLSIFLLPLQLPLVVVLSIKFIVFYIFLILTQKFFKLKYMSPILNLIKNPK